MSYTAFEACLDPERRPKECEAGDVLVLLSLAAHVNQKDVDRGWDWDCWVSEARIAAEVGLSPRQVRRRLARLLELGVVTKTGEHKGRGVPVRRISLLSPRSETSTPDTHDRGSDMSTPDANDRSHMSTPDVRDQGGDQRPPGHQRPAGGSPATATPDAGDRDPGRGRPPEPEGNQEENQDQKTELAHAEVRESGLSPSSKVPTFPTAAQVEAERAEDLAELALLEAQLGTTAHVEATTRAIADARDRLGLPQEVAA